MSEGPQVRLRTEWLATHAAGREIIHARSSRPGLAEQCLSLAGRTIVRCFCKGKHIFIECSGDCYLHNHLLMRGKWRRYDGQQLLEPEQAWLSLYLGPYTLCNLNGQRLRVIDRPGVRKQLAALGPDVMSTPYPRDEIRTALRTSALPITEALLRQGTVSGIGNVARSEALFLAGIDPRLPASDLTPAQSSALLDALHQVMWDSYHTGGRWRHRVYHRTSLPCLRCGHPIRRVRLPPTRRNAYYCPVCQA